MTLRFGDVVLDANRRRLFRRGIEIRLSDEAAALLLRLIDQRPRVLSATELAAHLRSCHGAASASLADLIAEIREAVDDPSLESRFIRAVPRFGFAFSAAVRPATCDEAAVPATRCWLNVDGRAVPLRDGVNLVGRDRAADVRLDAPNISRRHARIIVEATQTLLEDLGSRNGTAVRGTLVSAPVPLANGDDIRVASCIIRFLQRVEATAPDPLQPTP